MPRSSARWPSSPEAEIVALVRKELNKRIEIIGYAQQAGRAETVAQSEAEKAVLEAYLPAQLDAGALEAIVAALAAELGTTQIGPLMAELRKRHAGQFDGKLASGADQEALPAEGGATRARTLRRPRRRRAAPHTRSAATRAPAR